MNSTKAGPPQTSEPDSPATTFFAPVLFTLSVILLNVLANSIRTRITASLTRVNPLNSTIFAAVSEVVDEVPVRIV